MLPTKINKVPTRQELERMDNPKLRRILKQYKSIEDKVFNSYVEKTTPYVEAMHIIVNLLEEK